jgi:F-type H+-transporting ATPase subunit delta
MAESLEQSLELADVYAAALFGLAEKAGRVAETRSELEELVRLEEREPAFAGFMRSDMINTDRRQASLESMFRNRLSDVVLNTLLVLNRHGRAGLLPALLRCYVLREEHAEGQIEVVATSAVELDPPQRTEIERWAADVSRKTPLVQYVIDPEIVGGLIVQIGDYRFDDSVRWHLHATRARLLERSNRGLGIGTVS